MRGNHAKEEALKRLIKLVDKAKIISYFEPFLNKKYLPNEPTDEALNAKWVIQKLGK